MGVFSELFRHLKAPFKGGPPLLKRVPASRIGKAADAISEVLESARAEKQAKRDDALRADPAWRFVNLGERMDTPQSSNVAGAQYDRADSRLFVWYLDGSLYRYESVTVDEAYSFARSSSKGGWCWDNLRVRKTKYGARKEYMLIAAGEGGRAWEATSQTAADHSRRVAQESGAKSPFEKLGKFSRKRPKSN